MREQQEVLAAHRSLYRFLGLVALATLIVIGLTWSWFAAGFGAFFMLLALSVIMAIAGTLEYEDVDFGDGDSGDDLFRDMYGMKLGANDSILALVHWVEVIILPVGEERDTGPGVVQGRRSDGFLA